MTNTIKVNNELDNYGKLTEPMPDDSTKYNFKKLETIVGNTKRHLPTYRKRK